MPTLMPPVVKLHPFAKLSSSTETQSPQPFPQTPQRLVGPGWKTGGGAFPSFSRTVPLPVGAGVGSGDTNPVDPCRICAMRSFRLNLWVLAPEIAISNIEVSCSAVGLRAASKKLSDSGSSGFTGGRGLGISSMIGGFGPGGVGVVDFT